MLAGDEAAYRTFHDAYVDRLWRYLVVATAGDEEAAREALQSALVRVVRHIKVFPDEAVFWSWLTVLARSALADQNRRRWRYLAFLARFGQYRQIEYGSPSQADDDERLLRLLAQCLAALDPDERDLVERKYFARESVRHIAEQLQTTEKAVESRLSRIRSSLKYDLLAHLKNESAE